MTVAVGERAPTFALPGTDGQTHSPGGAPATVVVFTCNHCPYALAWHERIAQAARDYAGRGIEFLAVNPNDAERYPRDSFEAMKRRVAQEEWPMPYLRDETQEVARAYGALVTPDVFVLDSGGRVRYRGAPDAEYDDERHNAAWLRGALDAVLAGGEPDPPQTQPIGCSIKWKR